MPLSTASITPTTVGPNGTGKLTDLIAGISQAAQVGGDAFRIQGKENLFINNAGGSPVTVTIKSVASNFGIVASANDITLTIAAGKVGVIGPLNAALYGDSNGLAQITWSLVTSVTVALYNFATTA